MLGNLELELRTMEMLIIDITTSKQMTLRSSVRDYTKLIMNQFLSLISLPKIEMNYIWLFETYTQKY